MNRKPAPVLAAALAFMLAALVASCSQQGDTAKAQGPYPALWQIADSSGAVEGWLFGTIHALPDGTRWRSPLLDRTVEQADMLVVEVANLEDEAALAQAFEDMAFDQPPAAIAGRIAPERQDQFRALLEKGRVPGSYFDPMESWAAALALGQIAQAGKTENGADRDLLAAFAGREIVELEGARRQLAIFDGLPEPEQRDLLNAVLEETASYEADMGTMARAWAAGDTERLTRLTRKGMLADPELKQVLLLDRNRDWAARIENLLSAPERPLIAVGAGHLLGPAGLPALLEARGYTVQRIE